MKNKKNKKIAIVHGECFLFPSSIPDTAKRVEVKKDYFIVADSEVTGNHHVVDVMDGVEFFQDGDKTFMKNSVKTNIRCLVKERHDNIVLEPNTWEFGIQKEYDHIADELKKVAD
jgi:hypothetical protein